MLADVRFHTTLGPLLPGPLSGSGGRVRKNHGKSPTHCVNIGHQCCGKLTAFKIECDCIAGAEVQLIVKRRK